MKSFKDILYETIKARGIISIDNLEFICKAQKHKFDNATRTLRKLVNEGRVTTKRDERGCIIAYIYINIEPLSVPAASHNLQEALFKVRHLI